MLKILLARLQQYVNYEFQDVQVLGASVRNPARDKVMRKEADIRKACSDFRDPSGNS